MSPILFKRTNLRTLFVSLISIIAIGITLVWASRQHAGSASFKSTRNHSSVTLFADKGAITPAATTITVNSLLDVANGTDGLCTLREAIAAANNNVASGPAVGECGAGSSSGSDLIDLSGLNGMIMLASALPNISSAVAINGPGSSTLTVSRLSSAPNFTIFFIASGAQVSISGITISGGIAPNGNGGGIVNFATLTLMNSVVTNNSTSLGFIGGGIANLSGALNLSNCTISNNTAGGGGAGIYNDSAILNVSDTTIIGNTSGGGFGSGIYNGFGTATIINTSITGNHNSAGFFNGTSAKSTLTNTTISNNDSGGVLNNGTFSITGGLVTGNTNGAIIAGGTAVINGVTISNNSNNSSNFPGGGGLFINGPAVTVTNCVITNNSTNANGGGIRNEGGKATLINTTISGNTSNGGGGGLDTVDGGLGNLVAINLTITGNRSNNGGGVQKNARP